MAPRPSSAVTRFIYLGTLAAIAVVATLSLGIYRSAVDVALAQHSSQQLAMVRTAAIGVQSEIQAMAARLRQFASLPSVQNLDVEVLSQRIEAAFGDNSAGLINLVARADASGRLFYWTTAGEMLGKGGSGYSDPEIWQWASDRKNASQVRMIHGWANSVPTRRALIMPVWRNSPSTENPVPQNDFAGVIALVVDLNRFVEVYLGPAMNDLSDAQLVVGLATPEFGVRMGPGREGVTPTPADAHDHVEAQGTMILDDEEGARLHAWAKLDAASETWLVASSAPNSFVAGQIRRSAIAQLALTAMLLVALPLAGWLIARRDRRIQQEQRELERRLAESQKMEAIGKLAGGVAHDFNNMLTAILGYAGMIQEDAPPNAPIQDHAMQIRRAAENAAALTQKLLAFSRRQVLQSNAVDFQTVVATMLPLVRNAIGEDVRLSTAIAGDLWPILADHVQIEQSVLNLAINARDAMPEGGSLQIAAANAPLPDGEQRADADVKPGDYVRITVTDTGIGMDETTRTRMFEPFFTTKAPGKGTGLGLSTVYGFVRQCGGYIGVSSTPGRGTTIELLLPRANTTPAPVTPPAGADEDRRSAHETVLVAEDEDGVRQLAVESLERRGYRVLSAPSGEEAMKLATSHDGTIHLLISDVVMPGMKGPELAEHLRRLRPGIRVLLMSGYAADVVTPNDLRDATLLSKPFSPAALSKAVRSVLEVPLPSVPSSRG